MRGRRNPAASEWFLWAASLAVVLVLQPDVATGQDPAVRIERIAGGLNRPAGMALQPGTGDLLVAERGAGRVIRITKDGISEVIAGFGAEGGGSSPALPVSLAFLDRAVILVGTASEGPAADPLLVFELPRASTGPLNADRDRTYGGRLDAEGDQPACGVLSAIAVHDQAVFVICRESRGPQGWIARANRYRSELSGFERLVKLEGEAGPDAEGTMAGALLLTPGNLLVAGCGQAGNAAGGARLKFFRREGDRLGQYQTGLQNIVALAYSPERKRLFALDSGEGNPARAGLYKLARIRGATDHCDARRLEGLPLTRPVSMLFDGEGNLLIADEGAVEGDLSGAGTIWRIHGLDAPSPTAPNVAPGAEAPPGGSSMASAGLPE